MRRVMRGNRTRQDIMHLGIYGVDPCAEELQKRVAIIKVKDQSFQMLRILLEHPGEAIARDSLKDALRRAGLGTKDFWYCGFRRNLKGDVATERI